MKKRAFAGWKDIYAFTWKQAVEIKNFKVLTVVLAVILLVTGLAISIIMASVQRGSDEAVSPIQKVHIVDESELDILYLDSFSMLYGEKYPDLELVLLEGDANEKAAALGEDAPKDLIVKLAHGDNKYLLSAIIPNGSELSEVDAEKFLENFQVCIEQSKLLSSGIEMEKLVYAMSGVSVETLIAGEEEESIGEFLVRMFLPMIVIFILYMMTLLYGQSITNIVSIEKSSKLMEMVLTMVRPEALILGKIAATVSVALLQLALWIGCFVGGFFGGDMIAKAVIYPEYNNVIIEVLKLLQGQDGSTAFTVGAIILFVIGMCLGFLFYSVIAGLIASFISKAEEVGQCFAYYQLFVIAGFIGAYVLPIQEKEWINTILRIVPITSAYLLPGDILVGNITVLEGVLYMALLLIFTLVLVVVAGRVYKSQVFNRGISIFERFKKKNK